MTNPLDSLISWGSNNMFYLVIIGLAIYMLWMYTKISKKAKYKVIDREEVERQKFVEMMRFNKPTDYRSLWKAEIHSFNGGEGLINNPMITKAEKIGNIDRYLEFSQKPMKLIEKEGMVTYEDTKEPSLNLIGLVMREPFLHIFNNPFKKPQAMLLDKNDKPIFDKKNKRIIIPDNLGSDKLSGIYYMIDENTKPKIRNIIDARILVQDFNLMASRYYSKGQEQAVYSPEVAQQMMQLEKQLQIELAKKKGQQQTL